MLGEAFGRSGKRDRDLADHTATKRKESRTDSGHGTGAGGETATEREETGEEPLDSAAQTGRAIDDGAEAIGQRRTADHEKSRAGHAGTRSLSQETAGNTALLGDYRVGAEGADEIGNSLRGIIVGRIVDQGRGSDTATERDGAGTVAVEHAVDGLRAGGGVGKERGDSLHAGEHEEPGRIAALKLATGVGIIVADHHIRVIRAERRENALQPDGRNSERRGSLNYR